MRSLRVCVLKKGRREGPEISNQGRREGSEISNQTILYPDKLFVPRIPCDNSDQGLRH